MAKGNVDVDCMMEDCKFNKEAKCSAGRVLIGHGAECRTYEVEGPELGDPALMGDPLMADPGMVDPMMAPAPAPAPAPAGDVDLGALLVGRRR